LVWYIPIARKESKIGFRKGDGGYNNKLNNNNDEAKGIEEGRRIVSHDPQEIL
jgi:hypothetical protein